MKASIFALTLLFGATSASALDPVMKDLCEQTVKNYAHFSDTGQREKFSALFTHDGVLVTSGNRRLPAQVITEADRRPRTSNHVISNIIVREEDGKLTGTSYFTLYFSSEVSESALPISGQPTSVGVYHDTYVIEDGVCKFKERIAKASFSGRG